MHGVCADAEWVRVCVWKKNAEKKEKTQTIKNEIDHFFYVCFFLLVDKLKSSQPEREPALAIATVSICINLSAAVVGFFLSGYGLWLCFHSRLWGAFFSQ